MSFLTEAFQKLTRKTPATPRIIFNPMDSSYVAVDSRTGISRLQSQSIQPQVGMYSVLTIGDDLDVVVRYEKSLPYTLPVSSDEDSPKVTYVVPRQDMKIGDCFTIFVGRDHFMVKVIQILLKSSSDYDSSAKNLSDTSSMVDDISNASRLRPVQSSTDISGPPSPSTDHRQTGDAPISSQSPQSMSKPPNLFSAHPDRRDQAVFCTKTRVDNGKILSAKLPVDRVAIISSNHQDLVDLHESCDRRSNKTHPTHPSDKPFPQPESSLPPKGSTILDVPKGTREKLNNNMEFPPMGTNSSQAPLPRTQSESVRTHHARPRYVSSSVKRTHRTNRESISPFNS